MQDMRRTGLSAPPTISLTGRIAAADPGFWGYPLLDSVFRQVGDNITLATVSEVGDPFVAQAVKLREAGAGDRFTAQLAGRTILSPLLRCLGALARTGSSASSPPNAISSVRSATRAC